MIYNPHLEGESFFWEGGPIGVLLIHGFTATTAEVRPIAKILHQRGYTVAGPLLPGHYTHPSDLNKVTWKDWVKAVTESYQRLHAASQKVVVGGESTGGILALYLASQHPEISALLLYAPALQLNLNALDVFRLYAASPFVEWIPKGTMDSDSLWQGYPVNPLKGTIQLLQFQKQVRACLPAIHQPVLIVQGRLDTTVHPSVPDTICQQVVSAVKEKHWMDQSEHCVILDKELDQVAQITLDFIERHTGS